MYFSLENIYSKKTFIFDSIMKDFLYICIVKTLIVVVRSGKWCGRKWERMVLKCGYIYTLKPVKGIIPIIERE